MKFKREKNFHGGVPEKKMKSYHSLKVILICMLLRGKIAWGTYQKSSWHYSFHIIYKIIGVCLPVRSTKFQANI